LTWHSMHYRTMRPFPSYRQLHDGGGAFTFATFDGDVWPVTRASHTSQYETKYRLLAEGLAIASGQSATRLLCLDKSRSGRQAGTNSLRSGSYLPIVLRAGTNWTSKWVPNMLLWNQNIGCLPKVLAIAEGQKRYSPIVVRVTTNWTSGPAVLALDPVWALKLRMRPQQLQQQIAPSTSLL